MRGERESGVGQFVIVDDDEASRAQLRDLIYRGPYRHAPIRECLSGEEGLRSIQQSQPAVVFFDPSLPDMTGMDFLKQALILAPTLSTVMMSQLKMFELIYDAVNLGCRGYLLKPILRSELLTVLHHLAPSQEMRHPECPGDADPARNPIEWAQTLVERHYERPLAIPEIAAHVFLSPSYFSRLFKMETGITFVEYVTRIRLSQAKRLLRTTVISMEGVASLAGFGSASYFATLFHRMEGRTPSEYRQLFMASGEHRQ